MGIWKWMKNTVYSPPGRLPVLVLAGMLFMSPLAAKPTVGLRVMPAYYVPLGDNLLKPGFGVSGSFDFFPASYFGFFVDGEYVSIGLDNVSSIALSGGSLGVSFVWTPRERWTFRADLMAGLYSVTQDSMTQSGLSAGTRLSADYQINPVVSAGVNAGFKHYAYRPDPFMTALSVGAGVTLNLSEAFGGKANVSAVVEKQDPVFPVLYSWYDDNRLAMVKVTNNESTTITNITASFFCEQYMGQPKLCTVTKSLAPGESCEVPVKAFFNESVLALTEEVKADSKLIVEYRKLGSPRRAEIPMSIPIYDRNSMNWDDDRRAAAFVSSKDPAALWFSKFVSSVVSKRYRNGVNSNIQYAIGIFESLRTYGINYVVDPSSSYSDNEASGSSIDFLQYPFQTLMYRGGDCDDLSILYCSLFEAINIDAAFITIPGHIYVAFSTGLSEKEAKKTFYAPSQLAYFEGKAWVPLEITLTKDNFSKAWRTGAKEWSDANARGTAHLYPVKEAWKIYRPISVPGATPRFNLPQDEDAGLAFDDSLNIYIEREIRPQVNAYEAMIAKHDSPALHNRLGVLYGRFGMQEDAKEQFAVAARAGNTDAWVNLGNIAFQEENYSGALKYYNYVLSIDSTNSVALLGSARSYYELEQFRYSDALYAELGTRDSSLSKQYTYLASFFDNTGRAWSMSDRLATTTWCVSEGDLPIAVTNEIAEESSGPIDAKAFLASLAASGEKAPDIDEVDRSFAAGKVVVKKADLEPPAPKKNNVSGGDAPLPAAIPSGGLTAMITVVRDESDEVAAKKEVDALLKFSSKTPPDLPVKKDATMIVLTKPAGTVVASNASVSQVPSVSSVASATEAEPEISVASVASAEPATSVVPVVPSKPIPQKRVKPSPAIAAFVAPAPAHAKKTPVTGPTVPAHIASIVSLSSSTRVRSLVLFNPEPANLAAKAVTVFTPVKLAKVSAMSVHDFTPSAESGTATRSPSTSPEVAATSDTVLSSAPSVTNEHTGITTGKKHTRLLLVLAAAVTAAAIAVTIRIRKTRKHAGGKKKS